jgi:hypothetical protein
MIIGESAGIDVAQALRNGKQVGLALMNEAGW